MRTFSGSARVRASGLVRVAFVVVLAVSGGCASQPPSKYPPLSVPKSNMWGDRLRALWNDFEIPPDNQAELEAIGSKQDPRGAEGITDVSCSMTGSHESAYELCEGKFPTSNAGVCLGMALGAALHAVSKQGKETFAIEVHCTGVFGRVHYNHPNWPAGEVQVTRSGPRTAPDMPWWERTRSGWK